MVPQKTTTVPVDWYLMRNPTWRRSRLIAMRRILDDTENIEQDKHRHRHAEHPEDKVLRHFNLRKPSRTRLRCDPVSNAVRCGSLPYAVRANGASPSFAGGAGSLLCRRGAQSSAAIMGANRV
jgi:hypothetical protein